MLSAHHSAHQPTKIAGNSTLVFGCVCERALIPTRARHRLHCVLAAHGENTYTHTHMVDRGIFHRPARRAHKDVVHEQNGKASESGAAQLRQHMNIYETRRCITHTTRTQWLVTCVCVFVAKSRPRCERAISQ